MSGSRSWQAGRRPDDRQAEWSRRTGRRSLHESRRSRTVKLVAALGALALLICLGVYLGLHYQPVSLPALAAVGDPLYRDLAIPPNAGAKNGNHIDLVHLQEDAGYLFAPAAEPSNQDWNLLTADRLLQESRDRLTQICRDLPGSERTAVIYCGLFGLSRDGKAVFLVSDESGTDRQIPAAEWILSLSSAAEKVDARVLMLIDPGPAVVSWSEGILASDFASQLEAELDGQSLKNVCVVVASGPGETSWRVTDAPAPVAKTRPEGEPADTPAASPTEPVELGRSVFSYYVVSGLRGDSVDHTGRAEGTADEGPKGNRDGRITADELFAYLAQKVDQWATSHRGAHQTVSKLGGSGDFLVGAVATRPSAPKPLAKAEEPAPSDAKSGKTAAKESGPPSEKPKPDPAADAERRLAELWSERDQLAASALSGAISPDEWQALQSRLLAAELRLRIGLTDAATKLLAESEQQLRAIVTTAAESNVEKSFGGSWYRPFLPSIPVGAVSKPPAPADASKASPEAAAPPPLPELTAQLDEAAKAPLTMPLPNEQAIRNRLADRATLTGALDWAAVRGIDARTSGDWVALARVASLMPASEASPELRAIRRLADASKAWTNSDQKSDPSQASLAARLLQVTSGFGKLGLSDPASLATCRQLLADGLLATAAAERWLILADDVEETQRQLVRAETILLQLEQSTTTVSNARHLQNALQFQLPELAAWAASVREREAELNTGTDDYAQLRELSDRLDALAADVSSLDIDWGTLQRQIDDAWSSAQIDDARGTGSDLTTLIFGERRLAALLKQLASSDSAAADGDMLDRLRGVMTSIETLPMDIANTLADRAEETTWADIDGQLRFANLPGLSADRRQQLRQTLQSGGYATSTESQGGERPRWKAGTWHGFWSRQVLKPVAGDHSTETDSRDRSQIDQVWAAFLDAAADNDSDGFAARRAELAAAIRDLSEMDRRPAKGAQPAPGVNDVALLLGLFADFDSLVSGNGDLRRAWSSLPIQGRPASTPDEQLVFRPLVAELTDDPSVVATSGSGSVSFAVHSQAEQGRLLVKSATPANPLDVILAGQRLQGRELPVDFKDPQLTVQFRNGLTGNEAVIVALVDRDQFPLAIQRVRVVPEVGEDRWRIRFAMAASPQDVLPDAPEVLSLPPQTAESLALTPVLEFPVAAPTQNAVIEVQQRDSPTSNDWRTVLGPKTFPLREGNGVLSGDLRRIALDFTPASQPQPQSPSPTDPTAAATNTAFSFENGLRFLIRLDEKELPPREIWPVVFEASRFVSEDARALDISLEGVPPRIEALVTATASFDPRIPESVPIELSFDSRLSPLVGGQRATQGFLAPGTGGTLRLFGEIGDAAGFDQLLGSTGGIVALNVAGRPRAYRWRLRRGQEPDRIQPADSPLEMEFVKKAVEAAAVPPPGSPVAPAQVQTIALDSKLGAALIDPKDLGAVSLRYFVHQLDDRSNADFEHRPWTVIARRSEPGRPETSQTFFTGQIVRRFASRMNANVTGAIWNVSVKSEPHEIPLNFSASGRFEIETILRAPGSDDTDAASAAIRLVIDGMAPEASFVSPTPKDVFAVKGPLPIVCTASDEQSGIRSLELRVDTSGNGKYEPETDATKHYGESQLTEGVVGDPWYGTGDVKVRWDVPVALLPPSPGEGKPDYVTIWAVAENRLGATSEAKPQRIQLKREKPKTPPPPPTTGDIVVTVIPKPRPPVDPEIALVAADGGTEKRSGKSATFNKLKPGTYEIKVTQGTTGFKGQGEAKVTVEAGKTATVTIKVE